jgi:predicted MPP superfamily phosphohydrolase
MQRALFILLLILTLFVGLEYYTYNGLNPLLSGLDHSSLYFILYWAFLILTVLSIAVASLQAIYSRSGEIRKSSANVMSGLSLTLLLTKLVFVGVLLTSDIFRLFVLGSKNVLAFINDGPAAEMAERSVLSAQVGLAFATFPFLTFLHGITLGKYKYTVKKVQLFFDDLPSVFDGYRIVQFSDMHSGSFDSLERVRKGIEKMNEQEADLILFTGDMVNNLADEVLPFVPMLKELKAKDGKYSILGNHDYGDYIRWNNSSDKVKNLYRLINHQKEAGFELLMNEHVRIEKGGERIIVAGVENWGKPPFPQHGDLGKSISGLKKDDFIVMLSHDPSHWDAEILPNDKKIHLTLSGHTHGMQMGFDIPGFKWSPVKYKYPRWSGLYTEMGKYLYVNNGFGFLGFPGRVGIYPEITVLELCSAEKA